MNIRFFPLLLPVIVATPGFAGDVSSAKNVITPDKDSPWRVGTAYSQLLGLKTEFRGLGRFNSPNAALPLGGGVNRNYDNGFVRLDSSGNAGGQTWNWSYDNAGQYNSAGSGSIDYSITNSLANASVEEDSGSQPGMELFAYYDMGAANLISKSIPNATWGFRFGLQYSRVDMSNRDQLSASLTKTTDRFDLGGTIPPLAPYTGTFAGPGPLLGDSPTRSTSLGGTGSVNGNRDLDIDLTLLNLGTYIEIPVTEKFHALCEAGISLGVASGSYSFDSATSLTGLGTQNSSGRNSSTEILPGAYLGIGATYSVDENWSILANARYQYMDSFDISASDTAATLSFDSAFVLSLGCSYSF